MALLATPVASHLGGTKFGGFGAAVITAGSRGRATTVLVGDFTTSSLLSPTPTSSFATAPTFPGGTAAAAVSAATSAAAGEPCMAGMSSVGPLLYVSRNSAVPLSYNRDDAIAADTVTRYKAACLHFVFGRQSVNENFVEHVVVEGSVLL